jgi:hypothetical protein
MSNFRERYKQQKSDLLRRHEESVKDKGDSKFGGILDIKKVPKGINFWKCSEDAHTIDVIPFVAGSNMPKVSGVGPTGRVQKGDFTWVVDLYVHWNVGVLKQVVVCPTHTNGQPCPICEYLDAHRDEMSKKEYDDAKAKRRVLYLVWVHDNSAEEAKGVQIWEVAHYFMEYNLKEISERPKGGGTVLYFDPDVGKNILFKKRGKGAGNVEFIGHRFEDRDAPIPENILDQSFSLDEAVVYPTYEELYATFHGEDIETDRGSVPAKAQRTETVREEAVEESVEEFVVGECPVGGEFGIDTDQLENCKECPVWDDCYAANTELAAAQEATPEPEPEPEPPRPAPQRLRPPARRIEPEPAADDEPPRKPKPILRRRA